MIDSTGTVGARFVRYEGLPVLGLTFTCYSNGTPPGHAGPILSNYGTVPSVRYERVIARQ